MFVIFLTNLIKILTWKLSCIKQKHQFHSILSFVFNCHVISLLPYPFIENVQLGMASNTIKCLNKCNYFINNIKQLSSTCQLPAAPLCRRIDIWTGVVSVGQTLRKFDSRFRKIMVILSRTLCLECKKYQYYFMIPKGRLVLNRRKIKTWIWKHLISKVNLQNRFTPNMRTGIDSNCSNL